MLIRLMLRRASVLVVLWVAQTVCFGQTGGTALPLSTPANVWLNAGSGVTTSGSAVTTWVDQSGNTGRNATQGTGTAQPTFVTSSATFAGQSTLQFDGGDWLSGTWRATSGATQASLFAVYRLASSAGTQVPVMVGPGATLQGFGIGWNSSGHFNSFLWAGADSRINGFNSNTLIQAGTINGGTGSVWLNGQTATGSGGSASLGDAYNVGRAGNNSFNLGNGSQLAEIVIFESALSAADVTTMGNYLAAKYGVATSTSRLWSGGSSDATAAANWGGTLASGDQLVFQGANATSPTVGSTDIDVAGIAFAKQTADATVTAAFTLGGTGTITLGANGVANWAAATQTIAAPLSLSATSAWNVVGDLAVTGDIAGTGSLTKAGGGTLTLSGSNSYSGGTTVDAGMLAWLSPAAQPASGATTVANGAGLSLGVGSGLFSVTDFETLHDTGSLSNVTLGLTSLAGVDTTAGDVSIASALEGTRGVVKTGSGTLTLSGSNTYSGGTTVTAGTLLLANAAGLGSGAVTVAGGSLDLGGQAIANAVTLTGGGLAGGTIAVSQVTFNAGTVAAALTGSGGLTISGPGTIRLTGTNAYSGGTTVTGGTLAVAAPGSLPGWDQVGGFSVASGGALAVGAGMSDADVATMLGTGNFASGAALGFDTLAGDRDYTPVLADTGAGPLRLVTVGPGRLTLSGANTYSGGTTISTGTLSVAAASALGAGSIALGAGTLEVTGSTEFSTDKAVTLSGGGSIAVENPAGATLSGVFSGQGDLTKSGTGALTLAASNSYSGGTTVSAGTLLLANAAGLGTGAATIAGGSLDLGGQTIANAVTVSGGLLAGGTIAASQVTLKAGSVSATLGGTGGLTMTGPGTATLSGENTYSGVTTISGGTLSVSAVAALGSGGISLGAGTLEVTGSTAFSTNKAVALTGGGSFGAVNSAGMTLSGVLSDTGGFTKTGTGSLTISNAGNTYTGPTVVNQGTLIAAGAASNSCIRGDITINSGATLQLNVSNSIPDSSPITIDGGTFSMQTFDEYIGNLTLSGGAVVSGTGTQSLITNGVANSKIATTGTGLAGTISSRLALAADFGTVTGDRTQNFEVGTGARLDVTGAIIDTQPGSGARVGTLLKSGDGELRLSGANSYSGGTQITAGTLWFGGLNALGTGTVTLGDATLQSGTAGMLSNAFSLTGSGTFDSQANANTLSGAISGTGGLTKTGAGTLTLSGGNSFSGGTTVSQGTLAFASGGLGSTGGITLASSTGLQWAAGNTEDVSARLVLPGSGSVTLDVGSNDLSLASDLGAGTSLALTKAGTGTLTLSGSNTYSGGTAVDAGVLAWLTPAAQPASGTATVANGAGLSLGVGSGLFSVTDFETLHGTGSLPNVTLGVTSLAGVDTTAGDVSIAGTLGGTRGVAKTGRGTLTLSGSNTYSGLTLISAGTLSVANASALGAGSLSLGAGTLEVTGSTAFSTNRAVALTGGGSFAAANSGGMTLSGVLSGAGGFTKTGAGALTLSNARNTYTGPTIVNEGTLIAAGENVNSCIRGDITINSGATLQLNVQNCIIDTSPITLNGGTFAMQTNMEYMGNLTLGGGAVVSGSGTGDQSLITNGVANSKIATTGTGLAGTISSRLALTSQFGTVRGNRAQTFEVGTGARLDVTGAIIDTQPGSVALVGSLLKTGAGELRLSGTNTYSGGTTLSAGTLRVTSPSGLGSGNVAVEAGGRLSVAAAVVLGGTSAVSVADGGFLTVDGGGSLPLAASASLRGFESLSSVGGATLAAIRSGVSNGGTFSVDWLAGPQNSYSDALDLVTGAGTIAPFVLQMNFDAGLAGGIKNSLMLGWLDPQTSEWVNAVAGNTSGSATFFAGSWDDYLQANPGATATTALGAYGVDPVSNTVWAAVDHNSEFAVIAVPEPGTVALAGAALAAALATATRRRRHGR